MARICLIAFLAMAMWPSAIRAENDVWAVTGVGQFSCGHWTQNAPTHPTGTYVSSDKTAVAMDTQWVMGFLSAFNYYGKGSGNVLTGSDNDGAFAWIDNYCAAHPLD